MPAGTGEMVPGGVGAWEGRWGGREGHFGVGEGRTWADQVQEGGCKSQGQHKGWGAVASPYTSLALYLLQIDLDVQWVLAVTYPHLLT